MKGKVVLLSDAKCAREETAAAKWQRFVEAERRSKITLDLVDGIAAGKAYAAFVQSFVRQR